MASIEVIGVEVGIDVWRVNVLLVIEVAVRINWDIIKGHFLVPKEINKINKTVQGDNGVLRVGIIQAIKGRRILLTITIVFGPWHVHDVSGRHFRIVHSRIQHHVHDSRQHGVQRHIHVGRQRDGLVRQDKDNYCI